MPSPARLLRGLLSFAVTLTVAAGANLLSCAEAEAAAQSSYIAKAVVAAQASQTRHGVPVSVAVAQSILESGWGRSGLADGWRNYFGIKCSATRSPYQQGCKAFSSAEYLGGRWSRPVSRFRTYSSMTNSFLDHGRLLASNDRYSTAFRYTQNPDRFIAEVARAGYATDPRYAASVRSLMRTYHLYAYDRTSTVTRAIGGGTTTKPVEQRFRKRWTPLLRGLQKKTGISASALLAEAIRQSDWGRSRAATAAHNVFGIRCRAGEAAKNCLTVSGAKVRRYPTDAAALTDLVTILKQKRYRQAWAVRGEPAAFLRALQATQWSPGVKHAAQVISIRQREQLQVLDTRFTTTLRPGAHGPKVRAVQLLLTMRGVKVPATGNYRALTRAAVTVFQRRAKLPRTGIVDPATLAALVQPLRFQQVSAAVPALRVLLEAKKLPANKGKAVGATTRTSVEALQLRWGLRPTGTVDRRVWGILFG